MKLHLLGQLLHHLEHSPVGEGEVAK
jgi:hypothetical protein